MTASRGWGKASVLVAVLVLSAVGLTGCPFLPVDVMTFNSDDDGSEVNAQEGTRLRVLLSGNASTGYEWEIVEMETAILEHVGTRYRRDCAMPGCGQMETWIFNAVAPGNTPLRMIYHRPWEDVEPARTFELAVTVQGSE